MFTIISCIVLSSILGFFIGLGFIAAADWFCFEHCILMGYMLEATILKTANILATLAIVLTPALTILYICA